MLEAGELNRMLQRSLLDATPDCIKLLSLNGNVIVMNKAGCLALGIDRRGPFGMAWVPLLAESVREAAADALAQAAAGNCARFGGETEAEGHITHWDNLLTPIEGRDGRVASILCISRDVTENSRLTQELADAIAAEKLIAREMQHRVKNAYSLVSGLLTFAEREASASGDPLAVVNLMRDKLAALGRASDAILVDGRSDQHTEHTSLHALASSVLKPYGDRCALTDSRVLVPRDSLPTFALIFHELATNAVKYGALSSGNGAVSIEISEANANFQISWVERGGPNILKPPSRRGFGGEMVARVVKAARGTMTHDWRPNGLAVHLQFPATPAGI